MLASLAMLGLGIFGPGIANGLIAGGPNSAQARQLIPYIADAVPGWFQPVIVLYDAGGNESLVFAVAETEENPRDVAALVRLAHSPADAVTNSRACR